MPIDAVPCPHRDCVDIRDTGKPEADVLHCSAAQWAEFLTAIKAGKFDAVGSITAAICTTTSGQPANVCSSPAITRLGSKL